MNVNRAKGATHEMITAMAEASPHWLAKFQNSVGGHTQGHGTTIAVVLAIVSLAVAVGVWTPLRWPALVVGIVLSLAYWVFGQDLGGPFWTEGATDFNSGPLFVLLAVTLFPVAQLAPSRSESPRRRRRSPESRRSGYPAWPERGFGRPRSGLARRGCTRPPAQRPGRPRRRRSLPYDDHSAREVHLDAAYARQLADLRVDGRHAVLAGHARDVVGLLLILAHRDSKFRWYPSPALGPRRPSRAQPPQ